MTTATDWRGAPVVAGKPCIYATYNTLVEGEIVTVASSGKAVVRVVRRAEGNQYVRNDTVTVDPQRLVIVDALPTSNVVRTDQLVQQRRDEQRARKAAYATHTFEVGIAVSAVVLTTLPCTRCGISVREFELTARPCTSVIVGI